jgi:hypothetical protein
MTKEEVTMKTKKEKSLRAILAAVLWACILPASAQTFQNVPVAGGASLTRVSAGDTSAWGLDTDGHPYIYQAGGFVEANNTSLAQIAVGGGTLVQVDEVWALDSSGRIYIASLGQVGWQFWQVPGSLGQIAVSAGYTSCHPYEVWGINSSSQIFRYNFCTLKFEQIPGFLTQIAVGGGDIWGVNKSSQIFRFNFQTLTFKQLPGSLAQVSVGVDGVWGINAAGQVYQFNPSTQRFLQLQGFLFQIASGGNGVWGLNTRGLIYRFEPSTQRFVQIPGALAQITVGYGGGVWGINASKQVYALHTPWTATTGPHPSFL